MVNEFQYSQFVLFHFSLDCLDEELSSNEEVNEDMIDKLKKEFTAMVPNFEEHLKKKFPTFVFKILKLERNNRVNSFLERTISFERFISINLTWHIHQFSIGLKNQ